MNRESVNSSNIAAIGYDESSGTLEVEFTNGQVYEYFDVPEGVYRDFMAAASHGSFHHGHIRNKYRYQRV